MTAKTRRQQIEEQLAEDPNDPFLRYGLAMEHLGAGDTEAALRCLRDLIALDAGYVPAYQQCAQALARLGRTGEAADVFRRGIAAARQKGDEHAASEMQGMLDSLGE
jgi:thioredoxin-like negative regulator of GroEL